MTGILQENVKEMLDNAYIRERTEFKFYGGSKMNLQEIVTKKYNKGIADCSNEELYFALLEMTKAMAEKKENHNGKKKLYYMSAEFLIGKLLSNNLINLGVYD